MELSPTVKLFMKNIGNPAILAQDDITVIKNKNPSVQ